MKLLTYLTSDNEQRAGFIHNNKAVDLADYGEITNFPLPSTILELIDMGIEVIAEINSLLEDISQEELAEISYSLDEIQILAPIPKPRKNIIGIGLNYTEHVAESARTLDTTENYLKNQLFSQTTYNGYGNEYKCFIKQKLN